jgi:hypothetical protein
MKVLKIKFGMSGDKADAFGMRFYGDIDNKAKHLGSIGEMLSGPDMSPMIKNKRMTLWFTFEKICPYIKVSHLLSELMTGLRKEGHTILTSSIDKLVDTTSLEYEGTPESRFPASERMHGYNAAGGFSVTAEKTDSKSKFSIKEIETIQELAIIFGRRVYGRSLKKVDIDRASEITEAI